MARVQRYGITGLEVKAHFAERDGLCVLCHRPATDLDHDHVTGKVRGALCTGCNLAISRFEEAGWPEKAAEFVERGKIDEKTNG